MHRRPSPRWSPLGMQAWKQNLTDSLHVWFTPVWDVIRPNDNMTGSCSFDEIRKARAHTFGVLGSDFVVEDTSSIKLVSGQVGEGVCLRSCVCVLMSLSVCAVPSPPVALHIL